MQTYSDDLAAEYVRHFTQQELVIGAAAEARLAKTLLQRVTLHDALEVAREMRSSCSCIVKVEHHWRAVSEAQLLEVRARPALRMQHMHAALAPPARRSCNMFTRACMATAQLHVQPCHLHR
jgi:hypothetical protein